MTQIPLELIDPNPFRDFDLHPIDPVQVEKLRASIGADGFWASVVARPMSGRYQLAFGHHRIEAARGAALADVPIDVRELSDWQMVRLLASENATQRGTTAAAALDAIAAISKVLVYRCWRFGIDEVWENSHTCPREAIESIWGKVRRGEGPGRSCIHDLMPAGAFTADQIRTALGILKDSGRMATIVAEARAKAEAEIAAELQEPPAPHQDPAPAPVAIFDANCARLFRLDSHLAEFRRIVTGEVVQSYLPVEKQFAFAQQVIADLGDQELTAISLRERANVIFYEQLGMPRSAMRGSSKRGRDARLVDALNLLRRGVHGMKRGSLMLAAILDEGTVPDAMAWEKLDDYADELEAALARLRPHPRKKFRVIKGGDVA